MSDTSVSLDILVAHRGLQCGYPENTVLALKKAIEYGARFIELDVQYSNDCLPMIYHDPDLHRVSGCDGKIFEYSEQELLHLSAYEPERLGNLFKSETIAPLKALVSILKDNPQVTAFVELKEESISHCGRETMISTALHTLDTVKQQVVIISYDYPLVYMARDRQWPKVGVVLKQWQDLNTQIVRNITSDYIFVDHQKIPEDMAKIKYIKAPLVAYEVGDKEHAQQLLAKGVSMLETFELEQLSLS